MTRPFATIGFSFAAALVAASLLSLNGSIAMAVVCGVCFFVLLAVRPTLRMGRAGGRHREGAPADYGAAPKQGDSGYL